MQIPWRRGVALLALAVVWATAACASAEPTITASIGFDHQLVRYRFAPVVVTVMGLGEATPGRLVLRQYVGPDPTAPVLLEEELARGRIQNGTYTATIPAYDVILPMIVQLVDGDENVLASVSETVRQSGRGLPFRAVVGASYRVNDTEAIFEPAELPPDWWAYDPVSSVWLAAPVTARAAWLALGSWVTAGGSLVLFSGSDFFQWDSPLARELLPFTNPTLREGWDDIPVLTGDLRAGARVLLTEGNLPLLIQIPYGAGTVSLVTVRLADLDEMELRRIDPRIPASRALVSGDAVAEAALNDTPVLRPVYVFAPVVVAAVVAILLFSRRLAARRMRLAAVLFVGLTTLLAVGCGLYLNRLGHMAYRYSITTRLSMQTAFGLSTVSHAFFSLEPTRFSFPQEKGSHPMEVLHVPTPRSIYALSSELSEAVVETPARVRRFLRACDAGSADLRVTVDDSTRSVRVETRASAPLAAALLFADGVYRRVPVDRLDEELKVDELPTVRTSVAPTLTKEEAMLYSAASSWMPGLPGTWLLALSEEESITGAADLPTEVRVIHIQLVEGVEP